MMITECFVIYLVQFSLLNTIFIWQLFYVPQHAFVIIDLKNQVSLFESSLLF